MINLALNTFIFILFLEQSGAIETTSKDQKADNDDDKLTMNDSKVEWSDQEKRRLLDALKKYVNLLTPKSDWHLISPNNITPE